MIFHYPTMFLTSALAVISVAMAMMELKYVPGLIPCEKAVLYALMNRYNGTSLLQNILGCLRSSRSKLCFFVFFLTFWTKFCTKTTCGQNYLIVEIFATVLSSLSSQRGDFITSSSCNSLVALLMIHSNKIISDMPLAYRASRWESTYAPNYRKPNVAPRGG